MWPRITYDSATIIARVLPLPKRRRVPFLNRLEYLQYRFVAFLLDLIALGYLLLAWNFVAGRIASLNILRIDPSTVASLFLIVEVAALWGAFGTPLGARVLDLRLLRADGNNPTLSQRLIRFIAWNLALFTLALGHLWALGDAAWMTWADRLSGTVVVAQEKKSGLKVARPGGWYTTSSGLTRPTG